MKAIWQEAPFEPPYLNAGRCHGCAKCVGACPLGAIHMD
ncbi:MAG: 4Fe-4S binding protein [Chloroflexi bacterium]|nr:4Fe-4S binding protein [Chloroflexota bacterium]